MLIAIQIAVLIGCLKLLVDTERPDMCAGILAGVSGLLGILGGNSPLVVVVSSAITFAYCFAWFWLLVRVGSGGIWWLILAAGLLLPIVAPIAIALALAR